MSGHPRVHGRLARRCVLLLAVCLAGGAGSGCASGPSGPPPVSFIETLDGEPPPLIPSSPNLQVEQLRLIAKLDVENTGKSLYMGEWGPPSVTTARYFVFVGDDHDPSKAQPWLALGDRLDQPLLLYDHDEIAGGWIDATAGTLDRSVDSVRLTVQAACVRQEDLPGQRPVPAVVSQPSGLHARREQRLSLDDHRGPR